MERKTTGSNDISFPHLIPGQFVVADYRKRLRSSQGGGGGGSGFNNNIVIVSDGSGNLTNSSTTTTQLATLDTTSSIQGQFNAIATTYLPLAGGTLTGTITTQEMSPSTTDMYRLGNSSFRYVWLFSKELHTAGIDDNGGTSLFFKYNIRLNNTSLWPASRALVVDSSNNLMVSSVTLTELSYVSGVTGPIQGQLNAIATTYLPLAGGTMTGTINSHDILPTASATYSLGGPSNVFLKFYSSGITDDSSGIVSIPNLTANNLYAIASYGGNGTISNSTWTPSRALVTDATKNAISATTTAAEIGFVNGVTSAIQTQLNNKLSLAGGTLTGDVLTSGTTIHPVSSNSGSIGTTSLRYNCLYTFGFISNGINDNGSSLVTITSPILMQSTTNNSTWTASRALVTDASKNAISSATTATEIGYLSGVPSAIATTYLPLAGGTLTGTLNLSNLAVGPSIMQLDSSKNVTASNTLANPINALTILPIGTTSDLGSTAPHYWRSLFVNTINAFSDAIFTKVGTGVGNSITINAGTVGSDSNQATLVLSAPFAATNITVTQRLLKDSYGAYSCNWTATNSVLTTFKYFSFDFDVIPTNNVNLGNGTHYWLQVSAAAFNTISDANVKSNIQPCGYGMNLINQLKPCSYTLNFDKTGKTHYGLLAQDVGSMLTKNNMTPNDFAAYVSETNTDVDGNETTNLALNYTEFISPMIKGMQEMSALITTLQQQVATLQNLIPKV